MQIALQIVITPGGNVRCLYDEAFDLRALGQPVIRRGSHVEPTSEGRWTADLAPVGGPVLGPFRVRSEALTAERRWLERHWLTSPDAAARPRFCTTDRAPHGPGPARRTPGLERPGRETFLTKEDEACRGSSDSPAGSAGSWTA